MTEATFQKRDTPVKRALIKWLLAQPEGARFTVGEIEAGVSSLSPNGNTFSSAAVRPHIFNLRNERILTPVDLSEKEIETKLSELPFGRTGLPTKKINTFEISEEGREQLERILDRWDKLRDNPKLKSRSPAALRREPCVAPLLAK